MALLWQTHLEQMTEDGVSFETKCLRGPRRTFTSGPHFQWKRSTHFRADSSDPIRPPHKASVYGAGCHFHSTSPYI